MEYSEAAVQDKLGQFLRGFEDERKELKYRVQISNLAATQGKSVIVDYPDVEKYDTDLATSIVQQPDLFLKSFDDAALEILNLYNPAHAEKIKKEIHVRLRELTDRISLRHVTKEQLNTMIMVAGMVTRTSELRPLAVNAAFRCSNRHITMVEQDGSGAILKRPIKCETEGCGEARNFELDEKRTEFVDFQVIKIQEMPEELPPGQLPQSFDVNMTGDLVNVARPGDRIVLTGIVKAESENFGGASRKLFTTRIEANFTEQMGKRPEEQEITREEEEQIKVIAGLPGAYDKLVGSVAPAIFGHELHKEAALLLMVGSPQKSLPDGSTLRGDINILLVGDPGCLVYDERVVLGNGAIVKIGQMGRDHLQRISTQVLTGQGLKRATASTFHIYKKQPVIEIITESGKSLKGTPNHPVLARRSVFGTLDTEWRRLDEVKVGDRIAVNSGFHCTITAPLETNFKPLERKSNYGPAFRGKLPSHMDENLAALCGYMLGDGWVRKTGGQSGFVVADTDKDILPKLISLCKTIFDLEVNVQSKKAKGRTVSLHFATIHSLDVAANLAFIQTKRVPDLVLASGNKVAAAFLKWLYEADGTVLPLKRGSGCVGLKSIEIELLRDVQLLLLRFGIRSRIVGNALVIRRGYDILKFQKKIGFASRRKIERLREVARAAKKKKRIHGQRVERVVRLVRHKPQDVYDIEVPDGHRFIANGIISHNTAKSELLKYVSRVAPRGLFTSGRGSTAAGLTAAVVKEKNGMMMLEAGATVLADLGVACLTADTEIYNGQELVQVGKLWDEIEGNVFLTKTGREAKHALIPVNIYDKDSRADVSGMAYSILRRKHSGDVVKLTFASGLSLKVTAEHLLKRLTNVKNLWIRADQLTIGDELRAPVRMFKPSICFDLSPEESYVIGCIYGDGWFGRSNITISQAKVNQDVVEAIRERAPSVFALYYKGDRQRKLGSYVLISRMYQLYTTDAGMIKKTRLLLRNPSTDNILMLTDKSLWAFLAGVFDTDGDFNHVKGKITTARMYPTRSNHELTVVLYALRRLGVYARIRGPYKSIPMIQISGADITRFIEGIRGFSVKIRREKNPIEIIHKGARSIERGVEKVTKVEKIQYDGYVYDLSVGKYHNFEASLVYVHNCIDEFDKMRVEDRSALHEVMEQQSYHPSVEIALADGRRARIGDYVESLMRDTSNRIILGKDCEILRLTDGPEVYSCEISTGSIRRTKVDRVSRHKSPKEFVIIRYLNGRKIVVTPEHPVFVYREHSIRTVTAREVSNLDYAPTPRVVPNSSAPVLLTVDPSANPRNKQLTIPKSLTPELSSILGFLIAEGHSYAGSSYEIGFSNTDKIILARVSALFELVFGISPSIGRKHGVTTQRYISKLLFLWFAQNFPELMHHAREKRAPQKILGSSVEIIREFLASAFLGDGSLESTTISYRTASPGLAEDYQDLLHKLGIMSRIVHDKSNESFKVCIMGDSIPAFYRLVVEKSNRRLDTLEQFQNRSKQTLRGHDTLPPAVAEDIESLMKALGVRHSGYYEHIKRHFGVNRSIVLENLASIDAATSRFEEFARSKWSSLRSARSALGISQQKLASISGVKRGVIAYLEAGGYEKNSDEFIKQIKQRVDAYSARLRFESQRIRDLSKYRFLRISEVTVVPNSDTLATDWVYDVTVEPNHNFVSKGVILHNTVSVAKGGIIATLNARTSILAAANPVDGKYDPYKNILDNVALPIPLMTRFDLIFIIRDEPDPAQDETVAKHILDMRAKSSFPVAPPIDFELLKKYIIYAKKLDPEFTEDASNRLSSYYIKLRREAAPDQMSVTPRWLEGMIRLSIARARLLLHPRVTDDDALHAVNLVERMLNTVAVDQATKKVDVGVLYNKPVSEKGLREASLEVFKRLSGDSKQPVEDKAFYEEMEKTGKFSREQAEKVFQDMWKSGVIFEVRAHFFKKA